MITTMMMMMMMVMMMTMMMMMVMMIKLIYKKYNQSYCKSNIYYIVMIYIIIMNIKLKINEVLEIKKTIINGLKSRQTAPVIINYCLTDLLNAPTIIIGRYRY